MLDRHGGAVGAANPLLGDDFAVVQAQNRAGGLIGMACNARYLADRSDAGQRLAAKPECQNVHQIIGVRKLARGMVGKR